MRTVLFILSLLLTFPQTAAAADPSDTPGPTGRTPRQYMQRLISLMATHPRPGVRDTLLRFVREHKVVLLLDLEKTPPYGALGTTILDTLPFGRGKPPAMRFPGNFLFDRRYSDAFRQTVIEHEFYHFREYLRFGRRGLPRVTDQAAAFDQMPIDEVLDLFEFEAEAWLAQALLAVELGCAREHTYTNAYALMGETFMRQQIMNDMIPFARKTQCRDLAVTLHYLAEHPRRRMASP